MNRTTLSQTELDFVRRNPVRRSLTRRILKAIVPGILWAGLVGTFTAVACGASPFAATLAASVAYLAVTAAD